MKKIIACLSIIGIILSIVSSLLVISKFFVHNELPEEFPPIISAQPDDTDEDDTDDIPVIDFSDKSYAAWGSSTTWGYDYTTNAQLKSPYPKLVGELLNLKTSVNLGVSGATLSSNNLGRLCMTERILSTTTRYDIVSVMLGVNDWDNNLSLGDIDDDTTDTVYGSLNLICKYFKQNYSDSFIFMITPFKVDRRSRGGKHYLDNNAYGYNMNDLSNAIIEVCAIYGYPVCDVYNAYEIQSFIYEGDGLHASQEFVSSKMSPMIASFIRKNYR